MHGSKLKILEKTLNGAIDETFKNAVKDGRTLKTIKIVFGSDIEKMIRVEAYYNEEEQ